LCLVFINTIIKAQDIIIKKDGTEIQSKVLEINATEVKYKSFDYLDGPTMVLLKDELTSIKYPNGRMEKFNKIAAENNKSTTTPQSNGKKTEYNTSATKSTASEMNNGVPKIEPYKLIQ